MLSMREALCARCQTFMNPHLIHAMIDQGLYDEFEPPDHYIATPRSTVILVAR